MGLLLQRGDCSRCAFLPSPTTRVRLHPRWISSSTPSDRQGHLRKCVPSTVARRPVYDYLHDVREPLPSTLEDPVGPEHPRDLYNYFHYDMYHYRRHVNNYFLYRRRVQLLPTTSRERLLPLHRSECEPSRMHASRYNPETTTAVDRMHVV